MVAALWGNFFSLLQKNAHFMNMQTSSSEK